MKDEDISICNHEIKLNNMDHKIKGGFIEILDILQEKKNLKSAVSRRAKNILFLNS